MEDVSVRAITIGVGVLIAIATITAVLTYYNSAKDAVRRLGSGNDIAGKYEKSIEEILLKNTVTGSEVKDVLNYFMNDKSMTIVIDNITVFNNSYVNNSGIMTPQTTKISTASTRTDYNENYETIIRQIRPNDKFSLIRPSGSQTITIKDKV